MYIFERAERMPERKFACHCCGTQFLASAKETYDCGPAWKADCPFCGRECWAYQSDDVDGKESAYLKSIGYQVET